MHQLATQSQNAHIGRVLGATWILLLAVVVTLATPADAKAADRRDPAVVAVQTCLDHTHRSKHGLEIELHRWSREPSRLRRRHT